MIEKLDREETDVPRLVTKVNELIEAWNRRENERVISATTELLMKMTMQPTGLPLAAVHSAPDGEAMIRRLVDNGQAVITEGPTLELTDEGRAQGQAIFDSLRGMVPS